MATFQGSFIFDPSISTAFEFALIPVTFSGSTTVTIDCTNQGDIDTQLAVIATAMESAGCTNVVISGSFASPTFTFNYSFIQADSFVSFLCEPNGTFAIFPPQTQSPPVACPDCQEKVFSACQASYTIVAGLTADTEYTVVLTDRNEVRYTQLITTDASGDLTIDTTDFPASAFTPEFGGFTMVVYTDTEMTDPVDITSGGHIYGCVQLTFQHTVTTTSYITSLLVTDQLDYIITDLGDTFSCN